MALQSFGGIQSESLAKFGDLRRNVNAVRVMEVAKLALDRLWGPERAALVRCVSFSHGELKLASSSSLVIGELKLLDVRLRNEINRQIGSKVVLTLKTTQG